MKVTEERIKHGFKGQRMIVLPRKIISDFLAKDHLTRSIYITDIGYYPKAIHHYVERKHGINQNILIYCVEGYGWVEINGRQISIEPSQYIIIPANQPHIYAADKGVAWTIYWVHFNGNLANYVVDLIIKHSKDYKPYLAYNENRIKLFEDIYSQLDKGYSDDTLRYVNMIFYHFLSSLLYEEKFNGEETNKLSVVSTSITFMKQNLNGVLSLQDLADKSSLSVSHFSTVFKRETGYSPIDYFNHLKVQQACQYLLFTNMSIKEISFSLGIEDQYYFSRMFAKLMNASPKEYRNRNKSS
ncbi:helix-turn-helix domain-containing protein [Ilyomonas limi]|uniref:Helix-turn-helix domain-containing protein n=1 Tax=Ilyomonas limi TaxID=2575867 RepID=A0A4U3KQL9_9BACT|nr:AraC family transcriptional regulator [Ilyomonas limi]TKK64540.1 helix-turn-helix domain-containing protein [Ilyomonas limi]